MKREIENAVQQLMNTQERSGEQTALHKAGTGFFKVFFAVVIALHASAPIGVSAAGAETAAGNISSTSSNAKAGENEQNRLSAYMLHKTERMLKEQLSCLGCHQFGDDGGGMAPDLLQVKSRLSRDYVREYIVKPSAKIPGTRMPATRMHPAKLEALVSYLFQHQRPAGQTPQLEGTAIGAPADSPSGNAPSLFRHYCSSCHGLLGRGDGPNALSLAPPPTNLASADLMRQRPDDTLFDIIAEGGRVFDINPRMPAWGDTLSPRDIRSLVDYIRKLCQCRGPDWSRQWN